MPAATALNAPSGIVFVIWNEALGKLAEQYLGQGS